MSFLRFQIRHPNGQVEHLNVEGERVLIGSGAHCEIRLPVDQASSESVLIQRSAAGVFAQALSFEPAPTINNASFSQAPLQAESAIGIGQIQIFVTIAEGVQDGGAIISKKKEGTSPILMMLAAVAALGAVYFFVLQDDDKGPAAQPGTVPDLWDPPVASCPQNGPEQAMAKARESAAVADARRERRPFHVQDGVAAVPLYELASVCFRQGGDQGASAEASNRAAALRAEMQQDFRTHRVRLEHLLAVKDWVAARREVRTLLAYMEGKSGDYVTWLSNLERNLKLKVGRST